MREWRRLRRHATGALLLVASLGLAAGVAATDGPAAHWAFNETSGSVADDAAGALNGTIHGAIPIADGFDVGAFRFDGDADVTMPGAPGLRADVMALSLWVRAGPGGPPAAGQVIVDNGDILCGGNGYALVATDEYAKVVFRDAKPGAGVVTIQPAAAIVLPSLWDGNWHHVGVGAQAGEWGGLYLFIDGWHVGYTSSEVDTSHGIDYGTNPTDSFVIGRDDEDCGPGFVGDIDDVRVYDRLVPRDELAGLEPTIETSLSIDAIEPATVTIGYTDWAGVDVTLLPAPTKPGTFRVYVTAEDGIERLSLAREIGLGDLALDGAYALGFHTDYGGTSTVRVAFEAQVPALSSDASDVIEIRKAPSTTRVTAAAVDVAGDPISLGVGVWTDGRVQVTGDVELWEVTDEPVLIGSAELLDGDGTTVGSNTFLLAARPAGTYEFQAKYFGSPANDPSDSARTTLTVLPALEHGEVSINGGDATTDDPIVDVAAPATGAIALKVTTDPSDIRRLFTLPYAEHFTTWLTAPWFGDDADGTRTIWVSWADEQGRWSDWSTDTIVLHRLAVGTTTIDGGAGYTRDAVVTVAVPIADPSPIDAIELSNDGTTWTTFDYMPSINWTLSAGPGTKTVWARWVDADGTASMSVADSIVLDAAAPTATGPSNAFLTGSNAAAGKVPVRLTWSGSDATSGVARYELARSKDGGAYKTVSTALTSTAHLRMLDPGHTYRFRLRAIDRAGNVGAWAYGSTFRLSAAQEWSARIDYDGTWRTSSSSSFWGGAARFGQTAGVRATITVNARSFAWIGSIGPTRGTARVFVNGTLVATVNMQSAGGATREVVFSKTWASAKTRTIQIRISGTANHPRVDLDALVWGT